MRIEYNTQTLHFAARVAGLERRSRREAEISALYLSPCLVLESCLAGVLPEQPAAQSEVRYSVPAFPLVPDGAALPQTVRSWSDSARFAKRSAILNCAGGSEMETLFVVLTVTAGYD